MARRPPLAVLYAGLAAAGAVLPYAVILGWPRPAEFVPSAFFANVFATGPASVFAADVLWAAGVFLIFAWAEGRRLAMRRWWLSLVVTLTIGLCCALPLFLWRRERALSVDA